MRLNVTFMQLHRRLAAIQYDAHATAQGFADDDAGVNFYSGAASPAQGGETNALAWPKFGVVVIHFPLCAKSASNMRRCRWDLIRRTQRLNSLIIHAQNSRTTRLLYRFGARSSRVVLRQHVCGRLIVLVHGAGDTWEPFFGAGDDDVKRRAGEILHGLCSRGMGRAASRHSHSIEDAEHATTLALR
jgi:hypothetical protein